MQYPNSSYCKKLQIHHVARPFCVEFAWSSHVCVGSLSLGPHPQSKDVHLVAFISLAILCVWMVVCLYVLSLRQDGNLSEVYPASCFIVAGPLTLDCFSRREWMGGWVDYRQASSQASNVDFIGFVFCAQRFLQIPGSFWKTLCTEDAMFYFIEHYSETICRHIFSSLVNFCPF